MNWKQLIRKHGFEFCSGDRVDAVVDILCNNIFGSSMAQCLKDRYVKMQSCYRGVPPDDARWHQVWYKGELMNDDSSSNDARAAVLRVPFALTEGRIRNFVENNQYYNWGHDLPVWMHSGNRVSKRIMFVGQDPMRNGHNDTSHMNLSSPWGCHCESFTSCSQTRNIFARLISDFSCEIYLTDYSKLFFTERASYRDSREARPNATERRQMQENFILREGCGLVDILKDEIRLYKPDLIVTSGSWVEQVPFFEGGFDPACTNRRRICVGEGAECDFITLYHPRPRDWDDVRPTFSQLGVSSMSDYYYSTVQKLLDV